MSTAIYMRVSSRQQSTESQEADLKAWAARHDSPIKWYKDTFTGKSMDRKGFNKLMGDVRCGRVATIVIWRLDRLGRTARGLTALIDDLATLKVNLVSIKDGLDLSTPAGKLMANVLASVAQFETEVRGERIAAGIAAAKAAGKSWGGRTKGTRVKVTPEQDALIKKLKRDGVKVAAIARTVGLARNTIYSVIASA